MKGGETEDLSPLPKRDFFLNVLSDIFDIDIFFYYT